MYDPFAVQTRHYLQQQLGARDGKKLWEAGQAIVDARKRTLYFANLVQDVAAVRSGKTPSATEAMLVYQRQPVSVEEFVRSKEFLDKAAEIYPKVMEELIEINSGRYSELLAVGGIGSGKTSLALFTLAYQLYLLSCLHNPHAVYGLDPASEILMVFQSINRMVSTSSFKRFRTMIEHSPYFRQNFKWDAEIESRLDFPNRISVLPVSGSETAAIGQNVIGGIIDELNYFSIITRSKKSVDQGEYNQAVALYNSIARRRKTRFSHGDKQLPGMLCLVSSKRYPGQFTDTKEDEMRKEIATAGRSSIYLYDYRVWEVKPPGSFPETRFEVFAGDASRQPRILSPGEVVPEQDRPLVVSVPTNFRNDFDTDVINALREIAGMSTLARHPYFVNVELVNKAFGHHESIFSREVCDFVETKVRIIASRFKDPHIPRFAHVDLAVSSDSAGLAIGCCTGFKSLQSVEGGGLELMPIIRFDGMLEVRPPRNAEILFWKIREILILCRKLGLNIRWVTMDSFQSTDSLQILRQQGFTTGMVSVDRTPVPYDFLKGAIYSERVMAPAHAKAKLELVSLEKDAKTGKVDHPPSGAKDISDCMASVAYGLTMRREVWAMYHVKPMQAPKSVASVQAAAAAKEAKKAEPVEELWYNPV